MKKTNLNFLLISFCAFLSIALANNSMNIIPRPNEIEIKSGHFQVTKNTKILYTDCKKTAKYLQEILLLESDNHLDIIQLNSDINKTNSIDLILDDNRTIADEGYEFISNPKVVKISASSETGLFYGIQTLRQILKDSNQVPSVKIKDKPRFEWRAFMLDEARHFQGEKFVKKMIDQMAYLKINVLHWHLTDDQGWRVEIKQYPKLTKIGSKREDTQIGGWKSEKLAGKAHSGYYTQKQIREIVKYARERHITIVPEIEMPGHASAAIAAYPEVGTTGDTIAVPVTFGKKENIYNVADPEVNKFLKNILLEVMELFPSEVIHIGGDEVKYKAWKNSKMVKDLMKKEGLKTPADVQIYFTNQISKFLAHNGRRMMGWNEIFGGNVHAWQDTKEAKTVLTLAQNAIVHFWKGDTKLAEKAVKSGYEIVNSHHINTYLDYGYKYTPLRKAYNFNPVFDGLDKKYSNNIIGLGCQMWTEWTPNNDRVEFQTFPRIAAYAEVGWTAPENKNYKQFLMALESIKKHWKENNINFAGKKHYNQ